MYPRVLALVLSTVIILAVSGCSNCNHTGMSISAETMQTAAGAGGPAHASVAIHGEGFTPRTMVAIRLENLPVLANVSHAYADTTAITDMVGTFSWSKDISTLPAFNHAADPNLDVVITAKEIHNDCTATAVIKAGAMLNPPVK